MSELSSDARALIDAGRFGDEPAGQDKARVRERLVRQLGVGAFAGTGLLAVVRAGEVASAPRPSPASITDAPTLPRGIAPASKLTGSVGGRVGSALWVKSLGTVAVAATAAGAIYSGAARLDVRPSDLPPAPLAPPVVEQVEPTLEPTTEPLIVTQPQAEATPQPAAPAHAPRRARREPREAAPAAPAPAAKESLAEELALLARAQRLLRDHEPERALVVVGEHTERFPEGTMQEERAGIEALARCMLGNTDSPSVKSFLERSPGSPLAARVRKECNKP